MLPLHGAQVWSLGRGTKSLHAVLLGQKKSGEGDAKLRWQWSHWLGIHRLCGVGNYWIKMLEISAFIRLEMHRAPPMFLTYKVSSSDFPLSYFPRFFKGNDRSCSSCFTTHSPPDPPSTLSVVLGTSLGETHMQKSRTVVYRLFNCLQRIFEKLQTPTCILKLTSQNFHHKFK